MNTWKPSEHFSSEVVYTQQDFAWDKLNNPSLRGTRFLKVSKNAIKVVRLYQASSWIIEELEYDKTQAYNDPGDWLSSLRATKRQCLFRTKKSAVDALNTDMYWFDSLQFLADIQAAQGTGELLKVRYWGGTRQGQARYISVVNVYEVHYPTRDGSRVDHFWKAEVFERDLGEDRTYNVDKMELLEIVPEELENLPYLNTTSPRQQYIEDTPKRAEEFFAKLKERSRQLRQRDPVEAYDVTQEQLQILQTAFDRLKDKPNFIKYREGWNNFFENSEHFPLSSDQLSVIWLSNLSQETTHPLPAVPDDEPEGTDPAEWAAYYLRLSRWCDLLVEKADEPLKAIPFEPPSIDLMGERFTIGDL